MGTEHFEERRDDDRIHVDTTGKCKVLEGECEMHERESDAYEKMTVVNINTKGLRVLIGKKLKPEKMLKIELFFASGRTIHSFCEVDWCKEIREDEYMAGLNFVVLKEDDIMYLGSFLTGARVKKQKGKK